MRIQKSFYYIIVLLLLLGAGLPQFGGKVHATNISYDVRLQVNGVELKLDVPPLIKDNRTLVPVRGVFEALGGKVEWDAAKRQVTVFYQDTKVLLTIGSTAASVNEAGAVLDVPAQIINQRTLIPLRFVAESLNFLVNWDGAQRLVSVNEPAVPSQPLLGNVDSLKVEAGTSKTENTIVTIGLSAPLSATAPYKTLALTDPDRFAVDLPGFSLTPAVTDQTYADEKSPVTAVRIGQMTADTVRVVVDLLEGAKPTITVSPDGLSIVLKFAQYSGYFKPLEDGKLVVMLDPGHWSTTAGKRSPDGSLREYEFNQDMVGRVKALLEAQGIIALTSVDASLDNGTTPEPSLAERVRIANDPANAVDIFVSFHANASGNGKDWTTPAGWETFYYGNSILGKSLAKSLERATAPAFAAGLKNRGVKSADFYVIKYTTMPAILIEHGFYTNIYEVEKLKSDSWRAEMATYDATGIIDFLNAYK